MGTLRLGDERIRKLTVCVTANPFIMRPLAPATEREGNGLAISDNNEEVIDKPGSCIDREVDH